MDSVSITVERGAPSVTKRRHGESTERPDTTPLAHLDVVEETLDTALDVYEVIGEGADEAAETVRRLRNLAQDASGEQIVVRSGDYETAIGFVSAMSTIEVAGVTFSADIGAAVPGKFDLRTAVREAETRDLYEMDGDVWDDIGADGVFLHDTGTVHVKQEDGSVCGNVDSSGVDGVTDTNWLDVYNDESLCSRCRSGVWREVGRSLTGGPFTPDNIAHRPVSDRLE